MKKLTPYLITFGVALLAMIVVSRVSLLSKLVYGTKAS